MAEYSMRKILYERLIKTSSVQQREYDLSESGKTILPSERHVSVSVYAFVYVQYIIKHSNTSLIHNPVSGDFSDPE